MRVQPTLYQHTNVCHSNVSIPRLSIVVRVIFAWVTMQQPLWAKGGLAAILPNYILDRLFL